MKIFEYLVFGSIALVAVGLIVVAVASSIAHPDWWNALVVGFFLVGAMLLGKLAYAAFKAPHMPMNWEAAQERLREEGRTLRYLTTGSKKED